jgi:pimeloyl-ACP methyl ester carboxylesterase
MPDRETLRLADGRRLAYLRFGDSEGAPAIYLHGTPSSAREAQWLHITAREAGVRLISPDRPGYLGSDATPASTSLTTAATVEEMADRLGVATFALIGFSGGAGSLLEAAALLKERITVSHLGGGMGSFRSASTAGMQRVTRVLFSLMAIHPPTAAIALTPLLRLQVRSLRRRADRPKEMLSSMFSSVGAGPQLEAAQRYIAETDEDDLRLELDDYVAAAGCTRAVVDHLAQYAGAWRFDLASIETPVEIWHGDADEAVPLAIARATAASLPNSQLHVLSDEGHFVFHTHGAEIMRSVCNHAPK